jgi:replicative superfamily II helicase
MDTPIPARVLALAKEIDDKPLAWNEREDGSVVIVFCNKGKLTFEPEKKLPKIMHSIHSVIHTKEEAQEAVETLTPAHTPQPKKKGGKS